MTLRHVAFKNVIPLEVCNYIKEYFDNHTELHINKPNNPNVTKLNAPWEHFGSILTPILSKYMKITRGYGGNVYKHTNLYTTHVDSHDPHQTINVLIPIYTPDSNDNQHFVVFDQWMDNGIGRTWYGDRVDTATNTDFDLNKKSSMTPYTDDLVHDKTNNDIDPLFYKTYLEYPKHKPEYFKGLTGTAYDFIPGNLILFNSNNLHCTGKLVGSWKMGMFINFDGALGDLLLT